MSPVIRFDQFTLHSDDENSSLFQIRKALGEYSFADVEIFEAKTCTSIISLLTNKIVSLSERSISNKQVIFKATIQGTFKEIIDVEDKLNKLLRIDTSLFTPLISSSQRFHDSINLGKANYSVAFVLLIFSLEGISNILYKDKHWSKRKKLVRFVEKYVKNERFTKEEIRQLDFQGKQKNIDLVFRELLSQSYQYRCDYVHDGKMLPTLSKTASRLSMAFISNDQISVFPSYNWLRRITNLALVNFLNQEEHKGRNSLSQYFHSYEIARFKAKRAFPKGQKLDENYVYLQQLTDDFFKSRKRL